MGLHCAKFSFAFKKKVRTIANVKCANAMQNASDSVSRLAQLFDEHELGRKFLYLWPCSCNECY